MNRVSIPKPPQPCYCSRCQGAIVSRKTFLRHELHSNLNPPFKLAATPGFAEWLNSEAGSAGDMGFDEEDPNKEDTENNSEDEVERPLKRACSRPPESASNNTDDQGIAPDYVSEREVCDDAEPVGEIEAPVDIQGNSQDPGTLDREGDLDPQDHDLPAAENPIIDVDELREPRNDNELEQIAQLQAAVRAVHVEPMPEDQQPQVYAEPPLIHSRIEHAGTAQQFIEETKNASLDNGKLDKDALTRLRSPDQGPVDISDPDTRLSLDLFMACGNASRKTYTDLRKSILRRFPELSDTLLTYNGVKTLVAKTSGIVSVPDDVCINSCHAFTGPFANLNACYYCSEPRYDPVMLAKIGKQVPRKETLHAQYL